MMNFDDVEGMDLESLARPQPLFKALRETGPVLDMPDMDMVIVGNAVDVKEVLGNPGIYSSGLDAVDIGQVRPLIPLQIDPPRHKYFRRLLDPVFGRETVAELEPRTRQVVRDLIDAVEGDGFCNFHEAVAEPLPSTVFLQVMGLPVSRTKEFVKLKDGIIRPPGVTNNDERIAAVNKTGTEIYAILRETIDARAAAPEDDLITTLLDAEVDGEKLTHDQMEDILYLFFLAGLDTVTSSLDCMLSYLAQ
ncbi:MAG: cytochrome P450, partial [Actinobacteria bacterium]|nr:cytochrome P450 [Actinomycetota bacterium]